MSDQIIRLPAVQKAAGDMSRMQVYRKSRDPDDDFPAPVQLGPNSIGWRKSEIDKWIANRPRVGSAADQGDGAEPAVA